MWQIVSWACSSPCPKLSMASPSTNSPTHSRRQPGPSGLERTTRWSSPRSATTSVRLCRSLTIPRIAAEILRPYVRDEVFQAILFHQDFQGRHYFAHFNMDPNLRDNHVDAAWFALAEQFADEWDQTSFDPDYPTEPLAHFEAKVRSVFAQPRSI